MQHTMETIRIFAVPIGVVHSSLHGGHTWYFRGHSEAFNSISGSLLITGGKGSKEEVDTVHLPMRCLKGNTFNGALVFGVDSWRLYEDHIFYRIYCLWYYLQFFKS